MERHAGRHLAAIVGANIKDARGKQTQRALAQELGIPEVYISRWERGENTPSAKHLQLLADRFFDGNVGALYREAKAAA